MASLRKKLAKSSEKGASSLEFLVNYGWGLMIVVMVLAAIIFLRPFSASPKDSCRTDEIGVSCAANAVITENGVEHLMLSSNTGEGIEITGYYCHNAALPMPERIRYEDSYILAPVTLSSGGSVDLVSLSPGGLDCGSGLQLGSSFIGNLYLQYKKANDLAGSPPRQATVSIISTVAPSEMPSRAVAAPMGPLCGAVHNCATECAPHGKCDANDDGFINSDDTQYMKEYLVGIRSSCGNNNDSCLCDYDGNGRISVRDVLFFSRCLLCGNGICNTWEECSDSNTWRQTCPQDCCSNSCADSDGNDPLKFGNVSGTYLGEQYQYNDSCVNDGTVNEQLCNGNVSSSLYVDCQSGYTCSAGKCAAISPPPAANTCLDSDGNSTLTYGNVSGVANNTPYLFNDSCVNNATVAERLCNGNFSTSANINCASGYACSGGKCNAPAPNSCADTDGQNASTFGTVSGYYNNAPYSLNDWCVNNATVGERVCNGTLASNMSIACPSSYTCQNGYCLGATQFGSYAHTLYLDPAYSGVEQGTIDNPYNSWEDLPIQADTLYLMKRDTSLVTGRRMHFVDKNDVAFGTYGTGERPYVLYTGSTASFSFDGCSNIIVDGYKLEGGGIGLVTFSASGSRQAYNFTVRNCELVGGWRGVNSETQNNQPNSRLGNLLVENNIIHGQSTDGVFAKVGNVATALYNNIVIRNNHIYDSNMKYLENPGAPGNDGDNIHLLQVDNFVVENNVLDRRGTGYKFSFIWAGTGTTGLQATHGVVRYNTIYPPTRFPSCTGYCSGNGIYVAGDLTTFEYYGNKMINRGHPAPIGDTNQVAIGQLNPGIDNVYFNYNLFDNVGELGATTGEVKKEFNNNLFMYTGTDGYLMSSGNKPTYLRNNIFLMKAGTYLVNDGMNGQVNVHKQNNIEVYSNSLQDFDNAVHFANIAGFDYHLTSASTLAINQGVEYAGAMSSGLDGVAAPQGSARDIGPYEYSG